MGEMVTITVDRDDLFAMANVLDNPSDHTWAKGDLARIRVLAALPVPEWEPSREQVVAAEKALYAYTSTWHHRERGSAVSDTLKALHKAGFNLTLRDDRG